MILHPHQQKVARSPARYKISRGGRRSGKTVLKTETMVFKAVSKLVKLANIAKNVALR